MGQPVWVFGAGEKQGRLRTEPGPGLERNAEPNCREESRGERGAADLGQKLLTAGGRVPVQGDWVGEFKVKVKVKVREGARMK